VWPQIAAETAHSTHDAAVRAVAQAAARTAYVAMCLNLCWGVFVTTGWVGRLTGRTAMRRSHATLAVFAVMFALVHAGSLLFLSGPGARFSVPVIAIPLYPGTPWRWALGIVSLELMMAIVVSSAVRRFLDYLGWLHFHRIGYPAVLLGTGHSWLGAAANGHLSMLWLAGLTVLVVTALIAVLRLVPARYLARIGLISP
jgi:sulfoxide reductase heme-binding subunit YedZ